MFVTGICNVHVSICGGLYTLECIVNIPEISHNVSLADVAVDTQYGLWHIRLGHLYRYSMQSLKGQA